MKILVPDIDYTDRYVRSFRVNLYLSCLICLLSFLPLEVSALTVSPPYVTSNDITIIPAVTLETGGRDYDATMNFNSDTTTELTGSHSVMMIRNDFTFTDRFTIGLNLAVGANDYGEVRSGTDTLSLDGGIGAGGGLRVNAILMRDVWGVDWFADFQSFAMASDPPDAMLQREDWHLALGARQVIDPFVVNGGVLYSASKFVANGTSEEGTSVDIVAHETVPYGLFINTRYRITEAIRTFGEVKATDGITVNFGVNYRYKLWDYVPRTARQEVKGAEPFTGDRRSLTTEKYLARARVAINNENFQKALDLLSAALDKNHNNAEAHYLLARTYHKVGEPREALDYARYAVKLKPNSEDYHYQYALILERLGNDSRARSQYRRVLDLNPSHQEALYKLNSL